MLTIERTNDQRVAIWCLIRYVCDDIVATSAESFGAQTLKRQLNTLGGLRDASVLLTHLTRIFERGKTEIGEQDLPRWLGALARILSSIEDSEPLTPKFDARASLAIELGDSLLHDCIEASPVGRAKLDAIIQEWKGIYPHMEQRSGLLLDAAEGQGRR
jgi:hypothetical protein